MASLPLSPAGRRYGALKSERSIFELGKPHFYGLPSSLPTKYSIEQWAPDIKNQLQLGSCTGHGWTSHDEFLAKKFNKYKAPLSPLFVYYKERELEGTLSQGDCGAQVVTGAKVVDLLGAPFLSEDPYDISNYNVPPTEVQIQEALVNRTGAYHRLSTIMDVKECIVSGYAIVIGFTVFDSFENDLGSDGLMPMPNT